MRILVRELGYFILLFLAALCLLPFVVSRIDLRTQYRELNPLEALFIGQISFILLLILLALLYMLRFIIGFIVGRYLSGGGGGGKMP